MSEPDLDAYLRKLREALDVTSARADVIVAETRCHLEARAAELQEAGESRADAVGAAIREFGDPKATARALTRANGRHRTFRRLVRAALALCLLVVAAAAILYALYGFRTRLTEGGVGLASRPAAERFFRRPLKEVPSYDPASANTFQVLLQGQDLRAFDLSDRLPDLLYANFDTRTQWPQRLPAGLDPARFLALGKNPGLGLRALHAQGITGRGVSLAIVDQPLLVDHTEYADRLRLYEELHTIEKSASMHGVAVASIAAGRTVGVAPEADIYYVAADWLTSNPVPWARALSRELVSRARSRPGGQIGWEMVDFAWAGRAIERVLDLNRDLPAARKIRVISIEVGWSADQRGYQAVTAAVERAKREGVFVVSSSLRDTHGLQFHGLARAPLADPDDPGSFFPVAAWGPDLSQPTLLIPMDARATAAPTGPEDYAFYPQAGWSWVAPYVAGLYALACQVNPKVTPEVFWKTALATGTPPTPGATGTRAEVRVRVARQLEAGLAEATARQGAQAAARQLRTKYERLAGRPAPKVSEAALRDLLAEKMTDDTLTRAAGGKGKIVNPAALIEALRR